MTEKFQQKFRVPTARAEWWDYATAAAYFVTICTQGRQHFFGNIENGQMALNEIGQMTHDEWLKTCEIRPDMNLTFGEFVVMPNHFHAVIVIGNNEFNRDGGIRGGDGEICRETQCIASLRERLVNSVHNPKIWHPSFVVSNHRLPRVQKKWGTQIFHGNHGFMTTLFVMKNRLMSFHNTL